MSSSPAILILGTHRALTMPTPMLPMISFVDPKYVPGFYFSGMFGDAFEGHILVLLPCWICFPLGPVSCFVPVNLSFRLSHLCLRETEPESLRWQVDFCEIFPP